MDPWARGRIGGQLVYTSLYHKYRPGTFAEVIGQEHVTKTLSNAVERNQVFHAYLFSGPRGTGKTSTARILAKAINCESGPTPAPCGECNPCREIAAGIYADVHEIDAATHSKVEEAREFLAGVPSGLSSGARRKFYVVDEVHMLSTHAFNALLKTLEEPPAHVVFVLATTEPHKVPLTVAGRCQSLEFRLVPPALLAGHYAKICEKEGVAADPDAIELVARRAAGSVRDGLSLLDQVITALPEGVTVEAVESLAAGREAECAAEIVDAVLASDVALCFRVLHRLVEEGRDIRHFAAELATYLRGLLILSVAPDARELVDLDEAAVGRAASQAADSGEAAVLRALDLCGAALTESQSGADPRLALEAALVRMALPQADESRQALLARIERLEHLVGGAGQAQPKSVDTRVVEPEPRVEEPPAPEPRVEEPPAPKPRVKEPRVEEPPAPKPRVEETAAPEPEVTEPAPATAIRAEPAGSAAADIEVIRLQWGEILQVLRASKKARIAAILADGEPLRVDGAHLVVGFPPKHSWHAETLKAKGSEAEETLAQIAGAALKITAEVVDDLDLAALRTTGDRTGDAAAQVSDQPGGEAGAEGEPDGAEPEGAADASADLPPDTSRMAVLDLVRDHFAAEIVQEYRRE